MSPQASGRVWRIHRQERVIKHETRDPVFLQTEERFLPRSSLWESGPGAEAAGAPGSRERGLRGPTQTREPVCASRAPRWLLRSVRPAVRVDGSRDVPQASGPRHGSPVAARPSRAACREPLRQRPAPGALPAGRLGCGAAGSWAGSAASSRRLRRSASPRPRRRADSEEERWGRPPPAPHLLASRPPPASGAAAWAD